MILLLCFPTRFTRCTGGVLHTISFSFIVSPRTSLSFEWAQKTVFSFSSLDLFHTLYFYFNDKIGQGIQNQDFVSYSLLCPTVLEHILFSRCFNKVRQECILTKKATCEWLEYIRSQNGVKMFLNSKEMVWKGLQSELFCEEEGCQN